MLFFYYQNWKLEHSKYKTIIHQLSPHKHKSKFEITRRHFKVDFIKKKNSSLLCILVQGSIGKEPVRKPDVVANHSQYKCTYNYITIYNSMIITSSFFTRLSSLTSHLHGNTRRTRLTQGNSLQHKGTFQLTPIPV